MVFRISLPLINSSKSYDLDR